MLASTLGKGQKHGQVFTSTSLTNGTPGHDDPREDVSKATFQYQHLCRKVRDENTQDGDHVSMIKIVRVEPKILQKVVRQGVGQIMTINGETDGDDTEEQKQLQVRLPEYGSFFSFCPGCIRIPSVLAWEGLVRF